jgi:hypothetical protein
MTISKGEYSITTDRNKMNIDFIHSFLARSYWAEGITKEIVVRSINGSLCFGVFKNSPPSLASVDAQVGFARMVTDEATFAYLADVFIIENHRGQGLSKWLMEVILAHPGLQGLRRIMLATRDAHGLYLQSGFTPLNNPERWMQIHKPDVYKRN